MSCPQGLTLSGKMCTVAPILSCPSGYTLVNGMCQQDDGLQGFGDSMNIPPSGTNPIGAGEFGDQQQMQMQMQMQLSPPPAPIGPGGATGSLGNVVSDVGGMLAQKISGAQQQMMPMSPVMIMRLPNQQQPPPTMPQTPSRSRPQSPTRTISVTPPPPPPPTTTVVSQSPRQPVRPTMPRDGVSPSSSSPPPPATPTCPSGYSLNRFDMMCYPI